MNWRYVDRPLDRVAQGFGRTATAEHFAEDERGYLRPRGAWREWLLERPHLARDDGGAFFFVAAFEPTQAHAEYRIAGALLLYVDDDLIVELGWREHLGLGPPVSGWRYGFPASDVPEQFEILLQRTEHKGREFTVRRIPERVTRRVADAALEGWPAWPAKGSRTIFGYAGDHLINELWFTVPYAFRRQTWPERAVSSIDGWLMKPN